jgi:hypothetical protein
MGFPAHNLLSAVSLQPIPADGSSISGDRTGLCRMALAMVYLGARVLDANANAGVGVVIRLASERAQAHANELQQDLKLLKYGVIYIADQSTQHLSVHKKPEGAVTRPQDVHAPFGFPLPFDSIQGPMPVSAPSVARCRFCSFSDSAPDVVRSLGPHHEALCKRFVVDEADRGFRVSDLEERVRDALERTKESIESDYVVVDKQHVEGAAYRSGRICNGDEIVSISGKPIGANVKFASGLLRGDANSEVLVQLAVRWKNSTQELKTVSLKRRIIWGHTSPAGIFDLDRNYEAVPDGVCC